MSSTAREPSYILCYIHVYAAYQCQESLIISHWFLQAALQNSNIKEGELSSFGKGKPFAVEYRTAPPSD